MTLFEQPLAEWYEYQKYFIRRNVPIGKRAKGGYAGELEIVAFRLAPRHIVHIEISTDALSGEKCRNRLMRKFELGRIHIPISFPNDEAALKLLYLAIKNAA